MAKGNFRAPWPVVCAPRAQSFFSPTKPGCGPAKLLSAVSHNFLIMKPYFPKKKESPGGW